MISGTGIGLRGPHLTGLLARSPVVPWLELLADNYIGMPPGRMGPIDQLRTDYTMALHAVGMSVAGTDPLDDCYLLALRELADRFQVDIVSDHLCWTELEGVFSHDLLPIPLTSEALMHVCSRVAHAQDILRRPLVLENISAYVGFHSDEMAELEFFSELMRRTGCRMLLDLNNLYVNQVNLDRTHTTEQLDLILDQVAYMHLAGHRTDENVLVDTHDRPVCAEVWQLFRDVMKKRPNIPALIEWDHELPALDALLHEQNLAEQIRVAEVEGVAA